MIYVYIALYVKKYGLYNPVFNLYFLIQNINGGISVPLANVAWHGMTDGLCHESEQCFWLGRGGACAVRTPRALHILSSKLNKCSNCQLYLSHMKIPKIKSTIQRRYLRLILFLSVFKKYIIIKHDGKKAQGMTKGLKYGNDGLDSWFSIFLTLWPFNIVPSCCGDPQPQHYFRGYFITVICCYES